MGTGVAVLELDEVHCITYAEHVKEFCRIRKKSKRLFVQKAAK